MRRSRIPGGEASCPEGSGHTVSRLALVAAALPAVEEKGPFIPTLAPPQPPPTRPAWRTENLCAERAVRGRHSWKRAGRGASCRLRTALGFVARWSSPSGIPAEFEKVRKKGHGAEDLTAERAQGVGQSGESVSGAAPRATSSNSGTRPARPTRGSRLPRVSRREEREGERLGCACLLLLPPLPSAGPFPSRQETSPDSQPAAACPPPPASTPGPRSHTLRSLASSLVRSAAQPGPAAPPRLHGVGP